MSKKNLLACETHDLEARAASVTIDKDHLPVIVRAEHGYVDFSCSQDCVLQFGYEYTALGRSTFTALRVRKSSLTPKGRVGAYFAKDFNSHILQQRDAREHDADVERRGTLPILIAKVQMMRGRRLYWMVNSQSDAVDSINAMIEKNNGRHQWRVDQKGYNLGEPKSHWGVAQQSGMQWKWLYRRGLHFDSIVDGLLQDVREESDSRGWTLKVYHEPTKEEIAGITAPAATVSQAVRSLVNDWKTQGGSNPIVMTQWLEGVDDAIGQVEILVALRQEVQERLLAGLEFG